MPAARWGNVDEAIAEALPGVAVRHLTVPVVDHRTPDSVRARLHYVGERLNGARALAMRSQGVPFAYRLFFRKIGIDPDVDRTPVEQLVLERLLAGGIPSRGLVADALAIAMLETGVALIALDARPIAAELELREAKAGERLTTRERSIALDPGTLVLASGGRPLAVLFGQIAADAEVDEQTQMVELCAIRVPGVPLLAVEEALWIAAETIAGES